MREAPASVVAAVQEALGCGPYRFAEGWCTRHATIALHGPTGARLTERGCEFAVSLADAAWAVSYPAALRDAADRLREASTRAGDSADDYILRGALLIAADLMPDIARRLADESEATE